MNEFQKRGHTSHLEFEILKAGFLACSPQKHEYIVLWNGLHLQAVSDFAAWAFKTPEERAQCARMQAQVEAEVGAVQRMAKVCEREAKCNAKLVQSNAVV